MVKSTFSLSSFTFIKRLFSSSSLSAIKVVSSAYLRLLMLLLAILIPACASSSPAFLIMYSAYKLNKQVTIYSLAQLFATLWTIDCQAFLSMGFPGKNTKVGCHALLQWLSPTQGLKPHLSLTSLMFPAFAGRFFTTNATWEAQLLIALAISCLKYKSQWNKCHYYTKNLTNSSLIILCIRSWVLIDYLNK